MRLQISLIWGVFMMNLCIVIEVIQKRMPAPTMVMMPGTHPKTLLRYPLALYLSFGPVKAYESDHVCAIIARQT
jgi:hypothetical protein